MKRPPKMAKFFINIAICIILSCPELSQNGCMRIVTGIVKRIKSVAPKRTLNPRRTKSPPTPSKMVAMMINGTVYEQRIETTPCMKSGSEVPAIQVVIAPVAYWTVSSQLNNLFAAEVTKIKLRQIRPRSISSFFMKASFFKRIYHILRYNRRMKFREHHLTIVLEKMRVEKTPLDVILRNYFRQNKALGSKDRAWVSETLYHYVRWKNVYDELKVRPMDPLPSMTQLDLHLRLGAPQSLVKILTEAYGEEKAVEICQINQTRAPVTIRTNTLKSSREQLIQKLQTQFEVAPTHDSKWGINFASKVNFSALPEFKEGLFEVQDEASQLGAALVSPTPKQQILDYCAGAGGKSLAIAPLMHNSGQLYLHDIRAHALQEAKKRFKRAGFQNVQFNLPLKKKIMDWVIVDVPCSGTGTYRRNPDLKWKFDAIDLPSLVMEQRQIFDEAFNYLNPNGTIVYMTCSILPEENEKQIDYFQKKYALKIIEKFQTLPLLNGMDGFFAVSLKLS